jgi:hypothetical protein
MDLNFLEFEQPIAELEAKIDELRYLGDDTAINIVEEINRLRAKSRVLTKSIFASLTPWQVADRRDSTAGRWSSSATRRAATRRNACGATTACRSRKATERPCG